MVNKWKQCGGFRWFIVENRCSEKRWNKFEAFGRVIYIYNYYNS